MRSGTGAAILVTTAVLLLLAWPEGGGGAMAPAGGAGGGGSALPVPTPMSPDGGGGSGSSGDVTAASMPGERGTTDGAGTGGTPQEPAPVIPSPDAPPPPAPDSKVLVLGSVFFPSNATQLGPDARRMLDGIGNTYKGTAQQLEIVGHADARGSAQANMRLSAQRAEAVRSYLVAKGVPATNMTVSYDGARTPMAQGIDPEANAQNRRVEIRVP